jgi:hypothetical protein
VGIWIGLAFGLGAAACGLLWRFHLQTRKAVIFRAASTPMTSISLASDQN